MLPKPDDNPVSHLDFCITTEEAEERVSGPASQENSVSLNPRWCPDPALRSVISKMWRSACRYEDPAYKARPVDTGSSTFTPSSCPRPMSMVENHLLRLRP